MNPALANPALAPISNAKTILLTTYKRDGTAQAADTAGRRRILQAILVPAAHRLMRYRTLHYELVPG